MASPVSEHQLASCLEPLPSGRSCPCLPQEWLRGPFAVLGVASCPPISSPPSPIPMRYYLGCHHWACWVLPGWFYWRPGRVGVWLVLGWGAGVGPASFCPGGAEQRQVPDVTP